VFGDNLARVGMGGQAKAMRGEPNAVGIPTKASPYVYASDTVLFKFAEEMGRAFNQLTTHIWHHKGDIVWPEDGIGTGRAELETRAPKVWCLLQDLQKELFEFAVAP